MNELGCGAKAESGCVPDSNIPCASGSDCGGDGWRLAPAPCRRCVPQEGWRNFASGARTNIPRGRSKEIVFRPWQKQQCLAGITGEIMRAVKRQGREQLK